jgi:hypothetical protein
MAGEPFRLRASTGIEVAVDENVRDLEPDWSVPVIEWLQVFWPGGSDDLGLDYQAGLVVSDALTPGG